MKSREIHFGNPNGIEDIQQVLELQRLNLADNITEKELQEQGFVTVRHSETLLRDMNEAEPQIIAKAEGQVVGYALVMLAEFAGRIPVLAPMFELLESLSFKGKDLADFKFYVVGQVCVAKNYRGKGVFDGLYRKHRSQLSGRYDFVITEIASRNHRSLRAHARVGFKTIHHYTAANGEDWDIVLWDWE